LQKLTEISAFLRSFGRKFTGIERFRAVFEQLFLASYYKLRLYMVTRGQRFKPVFRESCSRELAGTRRYLVLSGWEWDDGGKAFGSIFFYQHLGWLKQDWCG
jgi:hypothetical protein